ncbi:MAG: hypothetical protein IIC83_06905 [Chloroflexi bacterium]|nr:hypothetical protein [Chloroflexota bacterium]
MTQRHSIRGATVPDVESKRDFLGFAPYVDALAHFLTNEHTIPPLTLSVEGEWGSGKSSFMSQLESAVVELGGGDNSPIIIKFNPWKHEEQESLWSAFALQYIQQVSRGASSGARFKGHVKLFRQRFNWWKGWPDILKIVAFVIFSLGIVVGLPVLAYVQGLDWVSSIAMD